VIKNCWVKTKILSLLQAEDLRTGVRRNNRIARDESSGLPSDIVDSLSDMLKTIGLKIGLPNSPPVCMATVGELLDMPLERAGSSSNRDYSRDVDVLNQPLMNVRETSTTRQSNLLSWIVHHASASSSLE
jgi:hypothetical protein